MKFKAEYVFIIGLGVLLIGSIIISGIIFEQKSNFNKELKQSNKELKELKEANKISIENVKELIDSANIYKIFAEREELKAKEVNKIIVKIKHETKIKIEAIDKFSRDAHAKYFIEQSNKFKSDTGGFY